MRYLERCLSENNLPKVIILDLNMPRLNGKQTLRHIKGEEALKDIPVVIYSTSLNPREKEECMTLGAHAYVIKPASYKDSIETANSFFMLCNDIGLPGNNESLLLLAKAQLRPVGIGTRPVERKFSGGSRCNVW